MELVPSLSGAVITGALLGVTLAGLNLPAPTVVPPVRETSYTPTSELVRWDLPVVRNQYVLRFVDLFEEKQPDRMALYLKRSGRYEGMIREKLRAEGLPEDLVYLSMVESGFNPNARSHASAVGLWQFMPATARNFGLRVDSYIDERRDPERSTDAAIRYLKGLHNQFGSWTLAAAAYNSGENRVARIMREETGSERGTEDDFWKIRPRLPSETREYVPLIFAAALIGKEPDKYGMDDVARLLPIPVERVQVPGDTPLSEVAEAISVDPALLKEMNPQLLRGATPPGRTVAVRVPQGASMLFGLNFRVRRASEGGAVAVAPEPDPTHRVANGESLWMIARRHGVTVAALQRANRLGKSTTIRPGQTLRIPV